jgi:tetrahydromethanopterin S-methyltransferase subunit G
LTNSLIQNIKTIDYNFLKDSLTRLPAEFRSTSWYYGTVINEVSKQRPEYFFRLAEDFPNNRNVIFMAAEDNKQVIQSLKAVENHTDIKKEFFKERKFGKMMPYKIIGTYAIVIGLITLLIVSQK